MEIYVTAIIQPKKKKKKPAYYHSVYYNANYSIRMWLAMPCIYMVSLLSGGLLFSLESLDIFYSGECLSAFWLPMKPLHHILTHKSAALYSTIGHQLCRSTEPT